MAARTHGSCAIHQLKQQHTNNQQQQHVQVLTLYGSVLYVAGGVLCFVQNMLSVREYQVFNGCTFALGTCIIFAHAVLQTVEWFCPQL